MTSNGVHYPDLYVMSKFPNLVEELQSFLPRDVKIVKIVPSDTRIKFDKSVFVSPEDIKSLQSAEVVVIDSMFLAQMLYQLPNLKWAQNTWTGVEMIFEEVDKTRPPPNFKLTRYVDPYFGELMSNYVIAQIINIERNMYELHEKQKDAEWARPFFPNFRVLSDLVIGVLGAGKLGLSIANHLDREGAKVLAYVKNNRKNPEQSNIQFTTDMSELFKVCDYICNVLPSTPDTLGLLDGEVLKACKKKPVFINVGRGDVIKEETIIRALNEGWISKAVLDVFSEEPLPPNSALWKMPEVIITPHIGAIPRISGIAKFIAENYMCYISGKELINEVSWNKGY